MSHISLVPAHAGARVEMWVEIAAVYVLSYMIGLLTQAMRVEMSKG